ncbi:MAG: hypothetical protein PF513_03810 [Tenericutes bacterium]|jgi:malic enzyme|nr:hypothetical protein [Mycoplasmatota bacterium]
MAGFKEKVLNLHKRNIDKLDILPNIPLVTQDNMSMTYTPGVDFPCLEIEIAILMTLKKD